MISFSDFARAARDGRSPYPWQERFADRAIDEQPPQIVAIPTGCGKTMVIDALVWALAAQAGRPPIERSIGVRIVWAIDRRLLVDEVHDQTQQLALMLDAAWNEQREGDPLFAIAAGLQRLKDAAANDGSNPLGPPLVATRWRGGVSVGAQAHHPLQAEVITSTVAQIGSRLLFRGFGVGEGSLPLAAALAACDTTICLDEAHLAEPFAHTLAQIGERRRAERQPVAPSLSVVRLSATPSRKADHGASSIEIDNADREVLSNRLLARKRAALVELELDANGEREHQTALTTAVSAQVERGAIRVACICNSIRMARAVFDHLKAGMPEVDSILLVGPQRPADRTDLLATPVPPADGANPDARPPTRHEVLFSGAIPPRPLIVVGTQALEVGLDIDVDAMVTQSASASALVQRFGRLNRAGGTDRTGYATIVRDAGFPLYEADEAATWQWLHRLPPVGDASEVDISVEAIRHHPPPPPEHIATAPELTDLTVELLHCTSPRPHAMADPDIEAFLRGVEADPASDVAICWRADMEERLMDESADAYRRALVAFVPPRKEEQLTISVGAARNLLRLLSGAATSTRPAAQRHVLEAADVEGAGPQEYASAAEPRPRAGIPFWVRRGGGLLPARIKGDPHNDAIRISELRPGDLVILPTSIGGADGYGLAPQSPEANDRGADVSSSATLSEPVPLRLTREALNTAFGAKSGSDDPRTWQVLRATAGAEARLEQAGDADERTKALERLISSLGDHPAASPLDPSQAELRRLTPRLAADEREALADQSPADGDAAAGADTAGESDQPADEAHTERHLGAAWVLLPRTKPVGFGTDRVRGATDPPPTLDDHCRAVASRAVDFASALGLAEGLLGTIELAAQAHDLGKADPRMQAYFYGGVRAPLATPIAKSIFGTADRRADRAARSASGLPSGFRHEQPSVAILEGALEAGELKLDELGIDDRFTELLLHLVSSHHGRCHPLPPIPSDGAAPGSFYVEAAGLSGGATGSPGDGWSDGTALRRSVKLAAHYGPWALAFLESILVLADRTVSSEGQ